jgi:hypothetical protein
MHSSRTEGSNPEAQDAGVETRLHLSGVATPILTRVMRQSARGMTVEQALPFLQLRTQVWDDSRQGSRIESVSVVVYDGVPRLVLDLAFDDVAEAEALSAQPSPLRRAHAGVVRPRVRVDETVPFDTTQIAPVPSSAVPRREATQAFPTEGAVRPGIPAAELPAAVVGLKLSVMEQELLQPRDFVFHLKGAWQRAQPHVQRGQEEALRLAGVAYRWARPRAVRALVSGRAWSLRLAQKIAERARTRSRPALQTPKSATSE